MCLSFGSTKPKNLGKIIAMFLKKTRNLEDDEAWCLCVQVGDFQLQQLALLFHHKINVKYSPSVDIFCQVDGAYKQLAKEEEEHDI